MGLYSRGNIPLNLIIFLTTQKNTLKTQLFVKKLLEDKMTKKVKLNASKRKLATKVFEKHYQNEDNILKENYYSSKEVFKNTTELAHNTMKNVIERNYSTEDIEGLLKYQRKFDLDVVNPDCCFHVKLNTGRMTEDYHGNKKEVFDEEHINFNLFGSSGNYSNKRDELFALAYYHDYLKQKGLTPNVFQLQGDKKDNPFHTELRDSCISELGGTSCSYESMNNKSKEWYDNYKLNVIMRSHYCNSRFFEVNKDEFSIFRDYLIAKENVGQRYDEWQSNIIKRVKVVEDTLKNYSSFDEVKELADNQKVNISVHDCEIESTSLTIFNPKNVSAMLDDLKPKAKETKAEKLERIYGIKTSEVSHG
jgi:hypothetical protein|tara:strand:+ start:25 stop:1113 length:1089 start_codon:yes stop_codon:yes gene_type:complete